MDIRKITVIGSFAAGAALVFAPLASATPDPLLPFVDSEISSMNSLFAGEVALAGDPASAVITHGANTFDTTTLAFAPDTGTPNTLDFELYGLNPIANAASDPGAYSVFNGALTEFDDAYNVGLFGLLNPTEAINTIPLDDLFGSSTNITAALATDTLSGAVGAFLTDGWNDLLGYFAL